jgi:hypothetical protein
MGSGPLALPGGRLGGTRAGLRALPRVGVRVRFASGGSAEGARAHPCHVRVRTGGNCGRPAEVVAQAWRSSRRARLARPLKSSGIDIAVMTLSMARSVGLMCAEANHDNVVDVCVVTPLSPATHTTHQDSWWVWGRGVPAKLGRRGRCGWSRAGVSGDRCAARAPAGAVTGSRVPDDGGGRPAGNRARPWLTGGGRGHPGEMIMACCP